jgi:hypothetical protein
MKDPRAVPNGTDLRDSIPVPSRENPLRMIFGALLFLAWGLLTFLWVVSTVYSVAHGDVISAVTAAGTLALMVLLGGMEGLEVSVIDCWEWLWPGRPTSYLARWLAARQLFVALIVTAATLLANRSVIVVPGSSVQITGSFALGMFDLTWTTLTVLWFAQIFPKHLGATNPDRYLEILRRSLFPIVGAVHTIGISQPGEWTADVVEAWLDWPATHEATRPRHHLAAIWRELRKPQLAAIWRELRKPHRPPPPP